MSLFRLWIVIALLAPLLAACPAGQQAGTDTVQVEDPRDIWTINDPNAATDIDHSVWDGLVAKYLRDSDSMPRRVDYEAFPTADKQALKDYLQHLAAIEITKYNRDQQIAFWMNLYNASIVDMVLESLPVNSVLQIRGPGLNVVGPWLKPVAKIEGQTLSFNDIEHYILRPYFNDMGPLVHYGLNCASMGCPSLALRAHTAENWRDNLSDTARIYVNSPHGVRFEDDELYTSKIYNSWFMDDFGGSAESCIAHLMQYAEPELAERLADHDTIVGDFYDWRLNKPDS